MSREAKLQSEPKVRGRPKKTAPLEVQAQIAPAEKLLSTELNSTEVDKTLDSAKGKFTQIVAIGLLPDGNIDIATNNPNYAVLNWLLNRGLYELLSHEKMNYLQKGKES